MTPTEEILAAYKKTEVETDSLGRVIHVGMLRPSDAMAVHRLCETDNQTFLMNYMVVASVRRIDEEDREQSDISIEKKNIGVLDAVMNRLGYEGMTAASKAYARVNGIKLKADEEAEQEETAPLDV